MNQKLADAAIKAINDPDIEQRRGFCSRFVRQVTERVYGARYDNLFGSSAIITCHGFQDAGFASPAAGIDLQVGDVLFKMAPPFGHVGIFTGDAQGVAENSSTSIGRVQGAKGFRSVSQWGHIDYVGRLPTPTQGPDADHFQLTVSGHALCLCPVVAGGSINTPTALCPVRTWCQYLGFDCDWDGVNVLVNGAVIPNSGSPTLIDNTAYLPVRALAGAAGLSLQVDAAKHRINVTK